MDQEHPKTPSAALAEEAVTVAIAVKMPLTFKLFWLECDIGHYCNTVAWRFFFSLRYRTSVHDRGLKMSRLPNSSSLKLFL